MSSLWVTQRSSSSSGAVALTVAPAVKWELHEVRAHFSGSMAAASFTITMDAGAGSKHDTLLYALSMSSVHDVHKTWNPPVRFMHYNDQIDIAYANSSGSGAAYGIEVVYKIVV